MDEILKAMRIIPLGRRKIAQLRDDRFVLYLPTNMNFIWKKLKEKQVNVYIEVPEE